MKRIKYFDIMKGLGIIFIVLGHALTYCKELNLLYKFIYSFHVPLFFFVSGFFLKNNIKFKDFVSKKLKTLILPYFLFAFLFLIPYYILGTSASTDLNTNISLNFKDKIFEIFYGIGANGALKQNSPLWFLPALFSTEIIFYFINRIENKTKNRRNFYLFFSVLLLIIGYIFNKFKIMLPWGITSTLTLGIFYFTGHIFKRIDEKVTFKPTTSLLISSLGIIIGIFCSIYNSKISYTDYRYGNYGIFIVGSYAMIGAIILISKLIKENNLLEKIGRNSLYIMIFHKIIIVLFQVISSKIISKINIPTILYEGLFSVLSTIISIFCILVAKSVFNCFKEKISNKNINLKKGF